MRRGLWAGCHGGGTISAAVPSLGGQVWSVSDVGGTRPCLRRSLSLSSFNSTKNFSLSALLGYVAARPDVEGMTYTACGWVVRG